MSSTIPECLLLPAHYGKPGWSTSDSIAAAIEGWNVFDCDGSENGPLQICMCDDMDTFLTDEDAWVHVAAKAQEGSALHQRALDFVKQHNPAEYRTIIGFVGG